MKRYKVSEECISCRACAGVSPDNFAMNNQNKAFVIKQPENQDELEKCEKALSICPVNAISSYEENTKDIPPILASANIKETLDKYPELKNVLSSLSPKFERLQTPALYNSLARFATFNDAAKITGLSVCEILHTINKFLGVEDKLSNSAPECIKEITKKTENKSEPISWEETKERYIYNSNTVTELVQKITELKPQENIVIISVEKPIELIRVAEGLNLKFNLEKNREYRLSVFNPSKETKQIPWQDRKDKFEILDVRTMTSDPFDIIIKKAYETEEDDGFTLVQQFEPYPMINMLEEMGFEHITEQKAPNEFRMYFHKKIQEDDDLGSTDKAEVVIQSATPVAYPVIMRLLQSKKIRKNIKIKSLKVWEETEKHLAWITSGKADISFSALITSAKLKNVDIKIPAIFVWDNFVLLTRYKANSLEDIKGKKIYTPLFEEAPPAKITQYLIKASGYNPDDFIFAFGKPFGRPVEIYREFVAGTVDTVILREPEASYAIKLMKDMGEEISIISFNDLWNKVNPGFGSFPNAGIAIKGEFIRKYPEKSQMFLEELKEAINWVNTNKAEAAKLSFDMMRQPVDRIELFLERVNFTYVEGEPLVNKVKQYFEILNKHNITNIEIDEKFLNIFRLNK